MKVLLFKLCDGYLASFMGASRRAEMYIRKAIKFSSPSESIERRKGKTAKFILRSEDLIGDAKFPDKKV